MQIKDLLVFETCLENVRLYLYLGLKGVQQCGRRDRILQSLVEFSSQTSFLIVGVNDLQCHQQQDGEAVKYQVSSDEAGLSIQVQDGQHQHQSIKPASEPGLSKIKKRSQPNLKVQLHLLILKVQEGGGEDSRVSPGHSLKPQEEA